MTEQDAEEISQCSSCGTERPVPLDSPWIRVRIDDKTFVFCSSSCYEDHWVSDPPHKYRARPDVRTT